MIKKILIVAVTFYAMTIPAYAGQIDTIYADIDAKLMQSNTNIFNYYDTSAVLIDGSTGEALTVDKAKTKMQENIRNGQKIEIYQSQIIGRRDIKTGFTGRLMGVVVFSKDFMKMTGPDPKNPKKTTVLEMTLTTTRVFDTVIEPKIISEHSSIDLLSV